MAEDALSGLTTGGGVDALALNLTCAELEEAQRGTCSESLLAQLLSESAHNDENPLVRTNRRSEKIVYGTPIGTSFL